jgi:hypothetical protein
MDGAAFVEFVGDNGRLISTEHSMAEAQERALARSRQELGAGELRVSATQKVTLFEHEFWLVRVRKA